MKLVPNFLYMAMVMLTLCLNIVNAATQRTFDPKVKGNLIGVTLISGLVLFLLVLLIFTTIRANLITIKAYFRKRNPSIRAIAPESRLNLQNLAELEEQASRSRMKSVELRDFADRRRHAIPNNVPIGTAMSDDTGKPEPGPTVQTRPSLIGLGIMTGRSDEILGLPSILDPSTQAGVGWQMPLDAAFARWGPPPTPPPTQPPPPIPPRNPRRRAPSVVYGRRGSRNSFRLEVVQASEVTDEEAEEVINIMTKEDKDKDKEVYVEEEKKEEDDEDKEKKEEKGKEVERYQGEEAGPSYTNGRFAARRSASADL